MVFGSRLKRPCGSAQQKACRGGIGPQLTPHFLPRPCPGHSHRGTKSTHDPTNSAWVISAGGGPGPGLAGAGTSAHLSARGEPQGGVQRPAPGSPRVTAQSAQEALLLGSQPRLRREPRPRSTRCRRCQSSAAEGKAGCGGAVMGCGAISRGNLAGSAAPQVTCAAASSR